MSPSHLKAILVRNGRPERLRLAFLAVKVLVSLGLERLSKHKPSDTILEFWTTVRQWSY